MKNLCLAIIILVFCSVNAQKRIPDVVKKAFSKQYENVKKVKWQREVKDYEASFKVGKREHLVLFDASGKVLGTKENIGLEKLPVGVLFYVKKNYVNKKIKGATKIVNQKDGVIFEVELRETKLLFDEKGTFKRAVKG
jgi:hypothetical protein